MSFFKTNIYQAEWLDIVFEKRNKSYGAYQLRKQNGRYMVRAFTIMLLLLSVVSAFAGLK